MTDSRGDVRDAAQAQDRDREVAQARHDLGRVTGPYLTEVLTESDIANPVQPVLDMPVLADERGEPGRAGLMGRQTGDQVSDLGLGGPAGERPASAGDPYRVVR